MGNPASTGSPPSGIPPLTPAQQEAVNQAAQAGYNVDIVQQSTPSGNATGIRITRPDGSQVSSVHVERPDGSVTDAARGVDANGNVAETRYDQSAPPWQERPDDTGGVDLGEMQNPPADIPDDEWGIPPSQDTDPNGSTAPDDGATAPPPPADGTEEEDADHFEWDGDEPPPDASDNTPPADGDAPPHPGESDSEGEPLPDEGEADGDQVPTDDETRCPGGQCPSPEVPTIGLPTQPSWWEVAARFFKGLFISAVTGLLIAKGLAILATLGAVGAVLAPALAIAIALVSAAVLVKQVLDMLRNPWTNLGDWAELVGGLIPIGWIGSRLRPLLRLPRGRRPTRPPASPPESPVSPPAEEPPVGRPGAEDIPTEPRPESPDSPDPVPDIEGKPPPDHPSAGAGHTTPTGETGGSPSGTRTSIRPNARPEEIRSLTRENEAADILANEGYQVEQNPDVPGNKNPDYRIEGKIFDCYAPKTANPRAIAERVGEKVASGQADRIVLNLSDSSVSVSGLRDALASVPDLQEVIVVRGQQVIRFFP